MPITPMDLEKKILSIFKKKKKITSESLEGKIDLYELLHLITLKEEFIRIVITNVDLKQEIIFNDQSFKNVKIPYFEIERKE